MSGANERRWQTALAALDANLLVALDALLQEANVTRAARRVGVTQPAMSQTLGRLRKQFDDPILVRVGRRMEPTPFAQRIKHRLHRALSELGAVVLDRPAFDPSAATDRFVIATVDYLALVLGPPLLEALAAEAPGARLALHALDAGSISDRLAQGVVHLYVGVHGATERALQTAPLFEDALRLVVRSGHPLAEGEVTPAAYAAHPHVHVSPRREAGSIVGRALEAHGLERDVAIEVPYFALVPSLLEGRDLVATLPESVARHFARRFDLVVREAPVPLPSVSLCAAWHPTYDADPAQRWLREVVTRTAGELGGR